MQVIIVLETKNEEGSDKIYLKAIETYFYKIRGSGIKISYLYMKGKGNYFLQEKKIQTLKRKYDGETKVVFIFDVDIPDSHIDQRELNRKIIPYCEKNNYDMIWYNRTVEHVLTGDFVKDNLKTKIANDFYKKNKIKDVDIKVLSCPDSFTQIGKSNVLCILDKYFFRNR